MTPIGGEKKHKTFSLYIQYTAFNNCNYDGGGGTSIRYLEHILKRQGILRYCKKPRNGDDGTCGVVKNDYTFQRPARSDGRQ